MTSPLLRKLRTTASARTTAAPTSVEAVAGNATVKLRALIAAIGLGIVLWGTSDAVAQQIPDPQQDYQIQLEPPGPQRLFRLESEQALVERIRQEARNRNERAEFPRRVELGEQGEEYHPGRPWKPTTTFLVPYVVCYNPLYFEEKNTERYGWDWSIFQPIVSTAAFYADVVIFPYNFGVQPCWECECNAGYGLPGDPMPYYFYLPPLSWKGALLQAAVVGGGIAVLP